MRVRLLGGVEGRSTNVSPEKCINLFYEKGENEESLINTPGASEFADLGNGAIRGGIAYNSLAYFVCGNTLYEVDAAGTATSRGTLNTTVGRVSMAHNGTRDSANQQIFIADGLQRYIYDNTTSTLTGYTDYAAHTVAYIDQYFVFNYGAADRWAITNSNDGTTVDAGDVSTAEGWPDKALSIISDQREAFIFGDESLEIFYNSGDTDNTFQRFQGGFKQTGCAARFSPARIDNNIYWLSRNDRGHGQVVRLGQNYLPEVVSSTALDHEIQSYSNILDAFGYAYQHEGHEFYVLTFPTAGKTWAYDVSTQLWHQRAHVISGDLGRERYNCHVFAFNKHLLGDYANGKIYKLDSTIATFDGNRVERAVVTPNIGEEESSIRISEVQVDMEEGVGNSNNDDTSIWLSWSKDGGHTYSNEIERDIGELGDYDRRVVWRRLGEGRNWTFKVRTWTPNKVIMKGLYIRPYGQ